MKNKKDNTEKIQIHLDPSMVKREKEFRRYQFNVFQMPLFRFLGVGLLCIFVLVHNYFLLDPSFQPSFKLFAYSTTIYAIVSWVILYFFFTKVKFIDLGVLFLSLDMVFFVMAVYFTGGDKSWLFFLPILRVADQTYTNFRRVFYYSHLALVLYFLMLVYLQFGEQRDLLWHVEICKLVFIYVSSIYIALTARTAEQMRNRIKAVIGFAKEEIVRREAIEKDLKESEERYRTVMEASADPIVVYNMEGRAIYINPAFTNVFGWAADDLLGKRIDFVPEAAKPDTQMMIQRVLKGETVVGFETQRYNQRGDLFNIRISAAQFTDSTGSAKGLVVNLQNITRQKQTEKELVILKTAAEAASSAKSRFLANMSHEIRTPMNAVLGFADMLMETKLSEDQSEYAGIIKRSGEALLSLINDILDFSKIEAGQLDFEKISFDPELMAYDVCEMIRPRIELKPIEVLCRIGDEVPSLVKGDPTRFRQVLTNLMGNAPKFTEKGEIELSIDVETETDDRVELHARIRDTGIGISEDKLDTIFEAFKQADGSTTRKYGGTGLGLSICRKIAELMEGKAWVESVVGQGSVFHFTGWFEKTAAKTDGRYELLSLSGKKVLVVDDNRTNLDIIEYTLKRNDMQTVCLSEGKDAVPVLKNAFESGNPFDICLLDIQMPDFSGYDTALAIRDSDSEIGKIPLLALSSLMERDAKKCEDAGFDGFLNKPVRREKLNRMMERLLGKKREETETTRTKPPITTQYSVREEMKRSVRILLVEDNLVNQRLAELMLTKAGYQLEIADDGQAAVEQYTRSADDFDLIFMDVQMPRMDGLEATRAIRRLETDNGKRQPRKTIPIIAMTAGAMKGDREECLEAGMDDYVSKPIKREIVYKMVGKWVLES